MKAALQLQFKEADAWFSFCHNPTKTIPWKLVTNNSLI